MEPVWANNCQSVLASSTPTSRGTFNRCREPFGVGIRFITIKIEALGSYNEDSRYIRYLDRLNSSAFSQVAVEHFGNVFGEF